MKKQVLSVIIPVFNEEKTVDKVLRKISQLKLSELMELEVIVVNDRSTDNSVQIIEGFMKESDLNLSLFNHEKNQGKGAALHTGLKKANGDFVVIQDADLEYDPEEYILLLKPVLDGHADVVYGSRFRGGNPHRALFFWHTIGNKFLTLLSNLFTNLNLTDIETCYKLFRKEIIDQVVLKEKRFGFEPEVTAKISRIPNIRIYEVGISYYGRQFSEGKKINWKDGFRALYVIIKYNVFQR